MHKTESVIVKTPPGNLDAFLLAMWLLYCRTPWKPECESDGSYWLGEIGNSRLQDQRMERDNPYSICKGIREE